MQSNADQSKAYNDQSNDESTTNRTVPVPEAARVLGISPEAVRSRIQRGTLRKEKADDGTVYVRLDADQTRSNGDGTVDESSDQSGDQTPLVTSLEEQISFLRSELVTRNEELRRKDHIIAALTERIPALEQGSEEREGHVAASEEPYSTQAPPEGYGTSPQEAEKSLRPRSWWRRFFGLE
jgi:hypothetical protein